MSRDFLKCSILMKGFRLPMSISHWQSPFENPRLSLFRVGAKIIATINTQNASKGDWREQKGRILHNINSKIIDWNLNNWLFADNSNTVEGCSPHRIVSKVYKDANKLHEKLACRQ
jgi:hypothetical protein